MPTRMFYGGIAILSAMIVVWYGNGYFANTPGEVTEVHYLPPTLFDRFPQRYLRFTDVTADTGINYQHVTGGFITAEGSPSRYMPETMGPGVTLFDYDGDGDVDIFVPNAASFFPDQAEQPTSHLYRNDGGFHFTDVTVQAGLDISLYAMGAVSADYDGDYDQDLLMTAWGGVRLFNNNGQGVFQDVTWAAGLMPQFGQDHTGQSAPDWATGAVFFDADNDRDLDLFVINYVRWTPANDLFATLDGTHKSFVTPELYNGSTPRLYLQRNNKFADATRESGIWKPQAKALGVALWDFADDGLLDIIVANDTQPNFLYRNLGNGRFMERGLEAGIAYDENGQTRAGMGVDIAEYLNDNIPSIAIGNFSRESVSLFQLSAPGFFREKAQSIGVALPTYTKVTFGLLFADMDLDGWQDLILANGHIEPRIHDVDAGIRYRQPLQLLGNLQNGHFQDWTEVAGPGFTNPLVGRGLASGDLDGDGDLDIVVSTNGGGLRIIKNNRERSPDGHYIRIHVRGARPNTNAIGAQIKVSCGDVLQKRIVRTGSSYLSQSEFVQTFGLGQHHVVDWIRIRWPSGHVVEFKNLAVDQSIIIDEETGEYHHL